MAVHRHRNQMLLDELVNLEGKTPFMLDPGGEDADLHSWTRASGLLDDAGVPVPAEGRAGLDFSPIRSSPDGQVFARRLVFDAAGALVAVGRERLLFKAGSAVFQPLSGGVAPKGSALMGERDEFYQRTSLGLEARKDFRPDSETPLMRADQSGENVELKPDDS